MLKMTPSVSGHPTLKSARMDRVWQKFISKWMMSSWRDMMTITMKTMYTSSITIRLPAGVMHGQHDSNATKYPSSQSAHIRPVYPSAHVKLPVQGVPGLQEYICQG